MSNLLLWAKLKQSRNLAMPKGPTITEDTAFKTAGRAQAADFYDSVGVNHHVPYLDAADVPIALDRLEELGIRNMRHQLWSLAVSQNEQVDMWTFMQALAARPTMNLHILWGTDAEPAALVGNTGRAKYKIGLVSDSNPDDTFFRALDGRTGVVGATNWPGGSPYYPGEIKYFPGTFQNYGWTTAAAFQGPNEPDKRTFYPASIRNEVHAALKRAKNGRPTETVLGGTDYIDSTTGRITPGPAKAPQLPVVSSPISDGFNDSEWVSYGDYTLTGEVDVAARHIYWGTQPKYREAWEKVGAGSTGGGPTPAISSGFPGSGLNGQASDRWRKQAYNGALGNARYNNELPYFVTETGWNQVTTSALVIAEYMVRVLIHNYLAGARRTYIFSLNDVSDGDFFAGLCQLDWTRRPSFYSVKNLLQLVGFVQGTSAPPTITNNFTATNNDHNYWGSQTGSNWDFDGIRQLSLRRDDGCLVILVRDRMLWDPSFGTAMTVNDPKTVTVTFPSNTFNNVYRAIPALTPLGHANDGQDYSWASDPSATQGTLYRPWPKSGNTFTTLMAGLTQVFLLTA